MSVAIAPVRLADGPALIAANVASRAHHAPFAAPFTDAAGFAAYFDGLVTGPSIGLLARDPDGVIAGVVNISQIVLKGFRSAYLGYYGMAGCAGRGLMTQAVRLAVRHGFEEIGLHRLEANIQPENAASRALVRRLGFRREGFSPGYLSVAGAFRDHERWAILADRDQLA